MLPKTHRLLKDSEYQRVWKRGKSFYTKTLGFKLLKNNLDVSRFGVVVGTKVSKKATLRNQIKRRVSEVLRLKINEITPGYDLIVLSLPAAAEKKYQDLKNDVLTGLNFFRLLK
jgi:ribonuclease P protein component